MAYTFASPEWVDALKAAINNSTSYREAAKQWEGDFYFIAEADPAVAGSERRLIYLDLWHGECRDAYLVDDEAARNPEFRVSGTPAQWGKVISGQLDPMRALMTNTLKIKGNMAKVMRNVKAAQELVNCAAAVPTAY